MKAGPGQTDAAGEGMAEQPHGDSFDDQVVGSGVAGVVDDRRRVHGLSALQGGNASIVPTMPPADTDCSIMMITAKAADLIRCRPPLSTVEGIAA